MDEIRLNGKPLGAYTILCKAEGAALAVAERLQGCLRNEYGITLSVCETRGECLAQNRILLGGEMPQNEGTYGDYALFCTENDVVIDAADVAGLAAGAAQLVQALRRGCDKPCLRGALQKREEYEGDATAFCPTYHGLFAEPAALDLESKRSALWDPQGRAFVIAHRGEHIFYPENSLESALSAWRCGADAVEVDIQKSADGVWMCMHDSDLTRTTNAAELLGKGGYPTSPLLADWSFAQLRTLRLKDAYGTLTPFLIPTMREILLACDGRVYVHLDKPFSVTEDIFPVMEELGVYQCVYLVNHIGVHEVLEENRHFAARGIRLDNLTRPRRGVTVEEVIDVMLKNKGRLVPAVIPVGDYVIHGEKERALASLYGDRIRFGAWFLRDFDYESLWREARADGISVFMTNDPFALIALFANE